MVIFDLIVWLIEESMVDLVNQIEGFLQNTLIPRLNELVMAKEELVAKINGYVDFEADSLAMENAVADNIQVLTRLVDFSEGIQVQAEYSSSAPIYMDVGLGFHVEVSPSMGREVALKRRDLLMKRLKIIEKDCNIVADDVEKTQQLLEEAKREASGAT